MKGFFCCRGCDASRLIFVYDGRRTGVLPSSETGGLLILKQFRPAPHVFCFFVPSLFHVHTHTWSVFLFPINGSHTLHISVPLLYHTRHPMCFIAAILAHFCHELASPSTCGGAILHMSPSHACAKLAILVHALHCIDFCFIQHYTFCLPFYTPPC